MPYVVLLKTGYYLSTNNRSGNPSQVAEMERANKYQSKQEAQNALKDYKTQSNDVSMSGVIRKVKS